MWWGLREGRVLAGGAGAFGFPETSKARYRDKENGGSAAASRLYSAVLYGLMKLKPVAGKCRREDALLVSFLRIYQRGCTWSK